MSTPHSRITISNIFKHEIISEIIQKISQNYGNDIVTKGSEAFNEALVEFNKMGYTEMGDAELKAEVRKNTQNTDLSGLYALYETIEERILQNKGQNQFGGRYKKNCSNRRNRGARLSRKKRKNNKKRKVFGGCHPVNIVTCPNCQTRGIHFLFLMMHFVYNIGIVDKIMNKEKHRLVLATIVVILYPLTYMGMTTAVHGESPQQIAEMIWGPLNGFLEQLSMHPIRNNEEFVNAVTYIMNFLTVQIQNLTERRL